MDFTDSNSEIDESEIDLNKLDLELVDVNIKTEIESTSPNVNNFGQNDDQPTIKEEYESTDFEIKKELLHSVCDLPTLKDEDPEIVDGNGQQMGKKEKVFNKYTCPFCIKKTDVNIKTEIESTSPNNVNNFGQNNDHPTIKEEYEGTGFDIKKELLHSVCDLPTLKDEDPEIVDGNGQQMRKNEKVFNKYTCPFCIKKTDVNIKTEIESTSPNNVNNFEQNNDHPTIKEEYESTDFEIKKELLHSVCDLPTLKDEDPEIVDGNGQQLRKKEKVFNKYTCPFCIKSFSSVNQRFKHECRRYSEICAYCGEYFYQRTQFLIHFYRQHFIKKTKNSSNRRNIKYKKNDAKYLQHAICTKQFQTQRHLKRLKNGKNILKCEICLEMFKVNDPLRRAQSKVKPVCCKICDKNSLKCLKVCLQKVTFCPDTFTLENALKEVVKIHNAKKANKCEICSKSFNYKCHLKKHMLIHTEEKPFRCEICSYTFRKKSNLNAHMLIHTGKKPFKCEICSHTYRRKSNLNQHMIIHTGRKPYKCEICPHTFRQKSNLNSHMRIHTGETPFKCEICSHTFRYKKNFKQHLLIHIGKKPFKCEICSHLSREKSSLKKHMLIHTGKEPFKCEICSHTFRHKPSLNNHMLKHTGKKPFKCEICSHTFRQKSNLNTHMIVHTGKKTFKCEICSHTSRDKSNLKQHMLIHTGEKPFKCEICFLTFRQKISLTQHMRKHNGQKTN